MVRFSSNSLFSHCLREVIAIDYKRYSLKHDEGKLAGIMKLILGNPLIFRNEPRNQLKSMFYCCIIPIVTTVWKKEGSEVTFRRMSPGPVRLREFTQGKRPRVYVYLLSTFDTLPLSSWINYMMHAGPKIKRLFEMDEKNFHSADIFIPAFYRELVHGGMLRRAYPG